MLNLFGIGFHFYGLLIGIGIWVAYEIALFRKRSIVDKKTIERILLWVVVGGILGARLYHVIDYWQKYYILSPIKIFYVWEGGLGIWGAIVGGMVTAYLYCLINKLSFLSTLDDLILGLPVAQAIGRLGNFVNGELYGKNGEPLFAYEAVLNFVLFVILWQVSKKLTRRGALSGVYLIGYGLIRITLEGLRPDSAIWRYADIPVAILFGIISIVIGIVFLCGVRPQKMFPRS